MRWALIVLAVLAIILAPFFLFGSQVEEWTDSFLRSASRHSMTTALVISALLASDFVMPIPSSVVSTGAGFLLGFAGGFAASWVGMMLSCALGFGIGRKSGQRLSPLMGGEQMKRMEFMGRRFGDWLIVITRAVPVLAEATVFFAGIGSMSLSRFLVLAGLSNAAVSAVYATAGAYSSSVGSFMLAFAASVIIPLPAMAICRRIKPPSGEGAPA